MSAPNFYPALLLLSHELRKLRTGADVSLRTLARNLGFTPASLSSWETGLRRPPPEALGFILGYLQVSPPVYRQLMQLHRQGDRLSCVEELAPDSTSLERSYEELAVRKFEWTPDRVPDFLRTSEYIREALLRRDVASDDIDQAIFTQQVQELDRPKHCAHAILVSEAAWASATRLPRLTNVTAGIVPASAFAHGTIDGFIIYETENGLSTVVLRHDHARTYLGDPDTVKRYRSTFARLQDHAVDEVGASR
ncbi:Scr1 family TA system antitoxin-like transcriptional regulator [Amycolatopsis sp. RTGN1]|uniref:Scr1 family TA system antitoxin-like transcriptional regulator n=1 Tax=Amycolatopsis ponsaeliensis TaxID=2992142 RepID=UPI00254A5179|nr:Scr1 family TA system antitoxin-like transcriptional regulator [Amycolatopsis sp. RTGN1]